MLSDLVGLALRTVVKVLHCTKAGWVARLLWPVVKVLHWFGDLGWLAYSGESVTLYGVAFRAQMLHSLSDLVDLALRIVVKVLHYAGASMLDRLLQSVVKVLHCLSDLGWLAYSGESVTLYGVTFQGPNVAFGLRST